MDFPVFSNRTQHDPTPNALSSALEQRRAAGLPVLDLTVSNPTRVDLPFDRGAILAALSHHGVLDYAPEPLGLVSARQALSRTLGNVDPDHILLTASTSEAYSFLLKTLCDPGDEVLVPRPSYPLFEHLAAFENVHLVPYRLAYDGEWHVDLDHLKRCVGARARAVVVVQPNNPTGSFLKPHEVRVLVELGLPVISDEVFGAYPLGPSPIPSLMGTEGLLVFCLGGLSKLCGLPQMKLAWTVVSGPGALAAKVLERLELLADTFLSPGTPVQVALPALLDAGAVTRGAIAQRMDRNMATLRGMVDRTCPVSVLKVEGGWSATLRLPRTRTDDEWTLSLLEHQGVYVHPGYFFDFEDPAMVVVSLLTPPHVLEQGISRLIQWVEQSG